MAIATTDPRTGEVVKTFDELTPAELDAKLQKAAEAAEAAGAQGMFWALHDMLFANQRELVLPDLIRYVHLLGLDAHRVQQELDGDLYAARVEADLASGRASGVQSTPAIFVNGVRYDGVHETSVLVAALLRARDFPLSTPELFASGTMPK